MKDKDDRRQAVLFPNQVQALALLGENVRLARKRRRLTQVLISERTGISRTTIKKIERGEPGVSIGHYASVLAVLGLADDLGLVAKDDELGRKLQDARLLSGDAKRKL
jgi:transcriptional regulator with XRE-family HTH domain